MSKHLAPNGKPSNLTHEQWHLVRTPEFKAWFGDWENDPANASKVVDENGEPLPVYHGSSVDFNLFENKPRKIGRRKTSAKGFYFTKDKWSATQYAGSDGFVKSYFLKILNYPSKKDKKVLEYANIDDYLFDYGKTINRFGYDGAIDVQGDFIVWNPEQIKLADGSNTTFDGSNPDIRYKEGGETSNYLKITRELDYSSKEGSMDGIYISADFGRNGGITWEIPLSQIEEGNKKNPIYIIVQSIDRNKHGGYMGKEDSKGEGTKAIASLFNKYPSLEVILYDDYAESGFWQKIGGDIDTLKREDFFKYYYSKFKK